ncbi:MAG: hypothetical protein ACFFCL_04365 [Promethearchaeota archaeon]
MNFAVPRKNNSEMLLYIWKVIDLPYILYNDLLYRISFDLFLLSPKEAKNFIDTCIENKFLLKADNNYFKLSEELNQKLKNWQKKRKIDIFGKIEAAKNIVDLRNNLSKESTNFSVLLNFFVDRGTLNRSVSVSDEAFELLKYDRTKGIIKSKVKGSKEDSYIIEVDINEKILRHDCHDFETRRADNKKFCKHITKLFLLLREKDENNAEFFLNELTENIDMWEFTS